MSVKVTNKTENSSLKNSNNSLLIEEKLKVFAAIIAERVLDDYSKGQLKYRGGNK